MRESEIALIRQAYAKDRIRVVPLEKERIMGCDGNSFRQFVASPIVQGEAGYLVVLSEGINERTLFQGEIQELPLTCFSSVFEVIRQANGRFMVMDCVFMNGKSIADKNVMVRLEAARIATEGYVDIIEVTTVPMDAPRKGEWYRPLNNAFIRCWLHEDAPVKQEQPN